MRRSGCGATAECKIEPCTEVAEEIKAEGGGAIALPCHVGEWDKLPQFIERVVAELGRIDVLINNAGIAPTAESSLAVTEELFDKTVGVNFKGPFRLAVLAKPHLRKNGGGSIINITSIGAIKPDPAYPIYAATKGALNIITRSQAMEFGPAVRVNAIMAGPFWTDITRRWRDAYQKDAPSAMERTGQPEEIVSTALYLASSRSSYTTGTIIQLTAVSCEHACRPEAESERQILGGRRTRARRLRAELKGTAWISRRVH